MKTEITERLVEEHRLILRMTDLLERNARATAERKYANWRFYLDGVEFIRDFADRFVFASALLNLPHAVVVLNHKLLSTDLRSSQKKDEFAVKTS